MHKHAQNKGSRIVSILMALLLIFTAVPAFQVQVHAEGEEPTEITLAPDKQKYKVNEPIIVTATGGSWVGIYKYGNDPKTTKPFYSFVVDGEPHNIYTGENSGRVPASIPALSPAGTAFTPKLRQAGTAGSLGDRL